MLTALAFLTLQLAAPPQAAAEIDATKRAAVAAVDASAVELARLAREIWGHAETALREKRSAAALADACERHGFQVERGVAGLPTAFVASAGAGRPVIGILAEYDALPGLSQKASATKEPLAAGAAGHGCGHNLFGPASLGAALALKERIARGELGGTVRLYGTPAEESVGGKIYMARAGLFRDVDVCLAWHPSDKTQADMQSTQALVDFTVAFRGRAAHAAYDPWNGRSAVDGLELFTHGLNMLREHVQPSVRIHYAIQEGGVVPNVVPEHARLWCWVRDWTRGGVEDVFARVKDVAAGAALMAGVEQTLTVNGGDWEMLVNAAGAKLLHDNLLWLGPIQYDAGEQEFARAIQRAVGVPETGLESAPRPLEGQDQDGGSTDVGDVSWLVPTLHVSVATAPTKTPWHSWAVVACGGTSIGEKGMLHAAKVLAATGVDLLARPDALAAVRAEFAEKTKGVVYEPYIPPGPPPLPAD